MQDILLAQLPTTTTVNAMRLAELAHQDNGHVTITWLELCDLWQCAKPTARRHLGLLHGAGIVHYSSNSDGCAYVTFKNQPTITRVGARNMEKNSPQNDHQRALLLTTPPSPIQPESDAARADARNMEKNSPQNDHPRALLLTDDPATYTHAGAPLVGWLDHNSNTIQKEPTNQPTAPEPPNEMPTTEQAQTFALCMEVRMRPDKAKQIAASVPFWQVRDAIGAWWCGRKSQGGTYQETPGIVVAALLDGKATLPAAPPEWERTDLYRKYRTRAERDHEAATVLAEPIMPQRTTTTPQPGSAAAIWSLFVASSGEDAYSELVLDEDASTAEAFVLRCPAHRMGWAERVEQRLIRGLTSVAGHPVTVRLEESCER